MHIVVRSKLNNVEFYQPNVRAIALQDEHLRKLWFDVFISGGGTMTDQTTNLQIKSSQMRYLIILVLSCGISLLAMIFFLEKHNNAKKVIKNEKPTFVNAMAHVDAESVILGKNTKTIKRNRKEDVHVTTTNGIVIK